MRASATRRKARSSVAWSFSGRMTAAVPMTSSSSAMPSSCASAVSRPEASGVVNPSWVPLCTMRTLSASWPSSPVM